MFHFTLLSIFLILLGIFGISFLIYFLQGFFKLLNVKESLNYRLFLIKIPREVNLESGQKAEKFTVFVNSFNQFLESFANYSQEFVFELAQPINSKEICFYLACLKDDSSFFEKNLLAFFPYAQMELVFEDYTIFNAQGFTAGEIIKTDQDSVLPIKTFPYFEDDPLNAIANAFLRLEEKGEGAAFQLIIKKAPKEYEKNFKTANEEILSGKSLKEISSGSQNVFKETLLSAFNPSSSKQTDNSLMKEIQETGTKRVNEGLLKLVEEKISSPLFLVNLRILSSAESKKRAEEILNHLENSFNQFSSPSFNNLQFIKQRGRSLKNLIYNFSFRLFTPKEGVVLNSKEITSLFHFPHPLIENNRVKWLKARTAPPPLDLPEEGALLGINNYGGEEREVRILDEDRFRHIYIIGQTGTGKSTLLKNIIFEDIQKNKGVCFIDPHGDAAEDILGLIPESRYEDVVYFNPGDFERSFGLNMLDWDKRYPFQKTFVINEMLEILDKLYDLKTVGGPVFEQYFRNAMLLLLEDEERIYTLIDLPRILVNADFRQELLERSSNPLVKEFWEQEAEKAGGELALANVAPYINSKLSPFLANDLVRPIIGQVHSTVDFRQLMDEKKIFIVNLSKGLLGETNSYLLGMIIVGKILMAAFSRVDTPEENRKDFYLFIDEFQNITTDTIATILSEARKYRLSLTLANQYLGQIKENILKAIFGNIGTIISFRVGRDDAEVLAKYFAPVFSVYDLMNLDNFNAYIKLLIRNQTSRPFNFQTIKSPKPDLEKIKYLKKLSALHYTNDREKVEREIKERYL